MAVKKGVVAAVVGTTAAPVTGYFIYSRVSGGGSSAASQIPGLEVLNLNRNDGKAFEINEGCIKTKFPELGAIKDSVVTSTPKVQKPDSEQKTLGTYTTEAVEGCLVTDVKYRDKPDKQHAVWAKLEMTLTKGKHGLIFRTMATNLLNEGSNSSFQALNQAYKLTKQDNNQWKIDHGYLWSDLIIKNLNGTKKGEKVNLTFDGLVKAQISFWNLCTMAEPQPNSGDQKCNTTDASSFQTVSTQKKTWSTSTGAKGIFEHLTIKGGKEGDEKLGNLWGQTSEKLFTDDLNDSSTNKYLYDDNNGFYEIEYKADDETAKNNLTKWFEPFKTEKGAWS